ncbi:MAG: hypothetical protein RLZZ196_48 [Bacteroidota bacterium]|jgi:hypothetical protein
MASNLYPLTSSPIKSIQRGTAASAGNVTISSVDISKSFVNSFSTGSSGTVAGLGTTEGVYTPAGGAVGAPSGSLNQNGSFPTYSGTRSITATIPNTNSFVSAKYGAYLINSTTITVTGACNWEVIEHI